MIPLFCLCAPFAADVLTAVAGNSQLINAKVKYVVFHMIYLEAHQTWRQLVVGLQSLLVIGVNYMSPGTQMISRVVSPVLSSHQDP